MLKNSGQPPEAPSIAVNLRRSALFALPFQVGSVALALLLWMLGVETDLVLTLMIVPAYWVPLLVELAYRTTLPAVLQLSYLVFVAAGPFAGSALHVYWILPWWDIFVHFGSGFMLVWLGLLMVRRTEESLGRALPRWFVLSTAFFAAVAFAGLWEIFEFVSDELLGTQTQHGLQDSMSDLLAGVAGALAALPLALLTRMPRSVMPPSLLRSVQRDG
jgi:hypothetical protein